MAAECTNGRPVPFPLTHEQRWIVHATLLDYVELASGAGVDAGVLACELGILEALERGDSAFSVEELDRIRHEVATYARAIETPECDRRVAEDLLERLDERLVHQPV